MGKPSFEVVEGCCHTFHKTQKKAMRVVESARREKHPVELIQWEENPNGEATSRCLLSEGFREASSTTADSVTR